MIPSEGKANAGLVAAGFTDPPDAATWGNTH